MRAWLPQWNCLHCKQFLSGVVYIVNDTTLKQGARRDLVDNINEVIGSHGGDRKSEHIKKNNVLLDSNRGGKSNNVLLATPPEGNTRQHALRKLRKDRYE